MIKLIVWSLLIAALLAGLPALQRVVLLPVYLGTEQQDFLSLVNRVSAVLLLPGKSVMYKISPPTGHYFATPQLLMASIINFFFYACGLFAIGGVILRRAWQRGEQPAPPLADEAPSSAPAAPTHGGLSRRDFLIRGAGGGGALLVAGAYPLLVRPSWLTVRELTVPIAGLPPSLSGFSIVQLTDLHHDEWISVEQVRRAVHLANSLQPDLVALTGDYVTARGKLIGPAVRELAGLRARTGVVGVMGNHDWWTDAEETRRQFLRREIPLIDNDRLFVTADRRLVADADAGVMCIGGVGDLWEDTVDPEKALAGVASAIPRILLSHNPDVTEQGAIGAGAVRIDLILSGHTHGGQVRLPVLGTPVVPSAYGQKYAHGLVKGPACRVHVSAGVGMGVLPVRIGVPPEVVRLKLVPA